MSIVICYCQVPGSVQSERSQEKRPATACTSRAQSLCPGQPKPFCPGHTPLGVTSSSLPASTNIGLDSPAPSKQPPRSSLSLNPRISSIVLFRGVPQSGDYHTLNSTPTSTYQFQTTTTSNIDRSKTHHTTSRTFTCLHSPASTRLTPTQAPPTFLSHHRLSHSFQRQDL